MRRQLVAEVRKLRTTRTVWGLLAALVALTSVGVVSVMLDARPGQLAAAIGDAPFLSVPIGIAWLFVLVLGLRSFTDEFRHGSIVPTLLADPDRRRVLVAKVLATAGAAVGFALMAAAVAFAIGIPWLLASGGSLHGSVVPLLGWFGRLLLLAVLWAAVGVGVGAAVRHQVAAIAGSLIVITVGEGLLANLVPSVARFLPANASNALAGVDLAFTGPLAGAAILLGWAALATAAGTVAMERRDIA
jgi:ABC-type transport system involved in multi-copper enzyme maturation permease subunit